MGREFKVGDSIVCFRGYGLVVLVNNIEGIPFPIVVEFENGGIDSFTRDGKYTPSDIFPTLFHIEDKPCTW